MKKLFRIAPDKHVSLTSGRSTGVLFSWQPEGTFLATVGKNGIVHIWDRHGEKIQGGEIQLKGSGAVLALEWDADGERVAVLQEGNPVVEIWEYHTKECVSLETNLKDPTFLKWAKVGHELAIGTAKGNLLLYNSQDRRKVSTEPMWRFDATVCCDPFPTFIPIFSAIRFAAHSSAATLLQSGTRARQAPTKNHVRRMEHDGQTCARFR